MSKPGEHFWVNGLVAVRDMQPYIQLSNEHGLIGQLTMAQARQVARDIETMCARTEADAMIHQFFSSHEFPKGAADHLMVEFRDFRMKLDDEAVEREHCDPPEGQ